MKRTILVCLFSSLFALAANAETSSTSSALSTSSSGYGHSDAVIPGGVVWSDGTHAIYYDLKAKTETDLTGDMKGAVAKWPVAASANGEWLMWHQGGKFWTRQLPKGTPYPITYSENHKAEKPFLYKLIEKRIRYCFTFSILDERLLLFLTAVAQTPGKAIMYLTYMQYWAKRHKQFVITFDDFCMKIFPHGFPNDEDLHDVWVKQKIKNGNLLDFQSAMVSIQFDDVKFKENT